MTATELLAYLHEQQVNLWVEGDRLRYNAPKGALTSDLRTELLARKAEVIELLHTGNTAMLPPPSTLVANLPQGADIPLSLAQRGIWFLDQLAAGSSHYTIPEAIQLSGVLNVRALVRSLNEIVRRHDVLRTSISLNQGQLAQTIAPLLDIPLLLRDLSALPTSRRKAEASLLISQDILRPFDLSQGPLIRVTLFRLDRNSHLLLLCIQHIVFDGLSREVLIQELTTLYAAFSMGKPSPLPELQVQYAHYAIWQQQWLAGETAAHHLSYWQKQLSGIPPLLELPYDRPRPSGRLFQEAYYSTSFSKELVTQLKELSQREGVTLFMTLLAAFQTLLYRYTGQQDMVTGTPIVNRMQADFEGLIGCFVNTLVLRMKLAGDGSFRALLKHVREVTLAAYDHCNLPFEQLVATMVSERNPSYAPLVQVKFTFYDAPPQSRAAAHLTLQPLKTWGETDWPALTISMVEDLMLSMEEIDGQLVALINYKTDLFDATAISRFMGHLQVLLHAIVAHPEQTLATLPILTQEEYQQMLIEWNNTVTPSSPRTCIHHLFASQAQSTPDAVALVFGDQQVSYNTLDQRANQIAHYLQKQGVKHNMLVGILLERSCEMIVGILGILKAGGAFAPLDPVYPEERLAFMIEDAQVSILLTRQQLRHRLPNYNTTVVCLDTDWQAIAAESITAPISKVDADNLAYIIYTSGSTGRPKGVLLSHRGVCNLARAQIDIFAVHPESRVLQFASFSFDAFVAETFTTLLSGATLHIAPQELLLPGLALLQLFKEQAITLVTLPPSLLAALPPTPLPTLQTLIVAGEPCPEDVVRNWANKTRFFNAYGPTEITVCATCAQYTIGSKHSSIGRPIANVEIYLLDKYLQPVPIGIPGELHVGGIGLADGYLQRADLTAERFIPHPFSVQNGQRLYKTGDLACYQQDGSIVFLGRLDRQVKLRGFRVEPAEIEAVLHKHSAVQQSAVVVQNDPTGKKRLAAFVVRDQTVKNADSRRAELWPSIAEYFIYDDLLYFAMTNDERRNRSYQVAIDRTVKDKVVVDIGTGKDAILARLCVESGARRVYALEILEDVYEQARDCIQRLGLEEKIILLHGDSTQIQLPEKVDVCVSELVGSIGGSEGATCLLNDAQRFLKPGGTMIPIRSITKIAAVSLPHDLAANPGFTPQTADYVQKIFEQVGHQFDLRLCVKYLSPEDLASSTDIFEDIDFTSYTEPNYSHEIKLTIHKQARIDGFLVWLNLHTFAGEEIDILQDDFCWLPVYLPVFYPGLEVSEDDIIQATCSGTLSDNGLNPDYALKGVVRRKNGATIPFDYTSFHHHPVFKQTPFYEWLFPQNTARVQSTVASPEQFADELRSFLKERLPAYMLPAHLIMRDTLPLTPNGKIDLLALSQSMEGSVQPSITYVQPQTRLEQSIATLWQQILDVEHVGIDDNFFDLGGHSLLLQQVLDGLRTILPKSISMVDLFSYPTIRSLLNYLKQEQGEEENFQQSYGRAETRLASIQRQRQTRQRSVLLKDVHDE